MSNNLFIEGPIQTGKSTLIRQVLGDGLKYCGGFTSQRVFDPKGNTFGFRLVPSDSSDLAVPLSKVVGSFVDPVSSVSQMADNSDELVTLGFFKYDRGNGTFRTDLSPFETVGIDGLKLKPGQKLLLLDEIGGVELENDGFRSALYDVLRSDVPCLGVIKLRENMERIRTKSLEEREALHDYYDELRQHIESGENARILYYERGDVAFSEIKKTLAAETVRGFIGY